MGVSEWCAERSAAAGEDLAGSAATDVDAWLLIEMPDTWGPKPPRACGFPSEFEAVLTALAKRSPGTRLQLIRRPRRGGTLRKLAYFDASSGRGWTRELEVDVAYDAAELERWLVDPSRGAEPLDAPWYLVCTHGQRDRCCAKFGQPIFRALCERPAISDRVWQTTHLGGHRFAPTLVALPGGHCWGRIESEELEALVEATERGRLGARARLRGDCRLDRLAQRAWCEAVAELRIEDPASLELVSRSEEGEATLFEWRGPSADEGEPRILRLRCRPETELRVLGSCGDPKDKAVERYRVERL